MISSCATKNTATEWEIDGHGIAQTPALVQPCWFLAKYTLNNSFLIIKSLTQTSQTCLYVNTAIHWVSFFKKSVWFFKMWWLYFKIRLESKDITSNRNGRSKKIGIETPTYTSKWLLIILITLKKTMWPPRRLFWKVKNDLETPK